MIKTFKRSILITGGAGFIGSHVVRRFVERYTDDCIVNLDLLTYAGHLANVADVEKRHNYRFEQGDIGDKGFVEHLFGSYSFDGVIHLAAESHVDRSIENPLAFLQTNIMGTANLLEASRRFFGSDGHKKFHHISTDEVYGSLGKTGYFTEETSYSPRSPYSASKASSDHLVKAYFHTYHLPVVVSNCSNNYGPFQFPEKLIPLSIIRFLKGEQVPVYGQGRNVRDWLYVEDHAKAIDLVFHFGQLGETYNVGGYGERENIDVVRQIGMLIDKRMGRPEGSYESQISFVKDRAGHDHRYAIDPTKIKSKLGWNPDTTFEEGLEKTVDWYLARPDWVQKVSTIEYQKFIEKQYAGVV